MDTDQTIDFTVDDLTTEDIDFSEIETDMESLQNNPQILKIIMEGKDLRDYGRRVEEGLLAVQQGTIADCTPPIINLTLNRSQGR